MSLAKKNYLKDKRSKVFVIIEENETIIEIHKDNNIQWRSIAIDKLDSVDQSWLSNILSMAESLITKNRKKDE